MVIEGAPGIGKTSILAEARARAAASGFVVLHGRGSQMESAFLFGVARQVFEALLARADPARRAQLLAGAAAHAGRLFSARTIADAPSGEDAAFALLHGLYWLALNLADSQPVTIAVDDLQWADAPSLRWWPTWRGLLAILRFRSVCSGSWCQAGDGCGADVCLRYEPVAVGRRAELGAASGGGEYHGGRVRQGAQAAGEAEPGVSPWGDVDDGHVGTERAGCRERVIACCKVGHDVDALGTQQRAVGRARDFVVIHEQDPRRPGAAGGAGEAGLHDPTVPAQGHRSHQ
jgi:hypothetical protein